MGRNLVGILVGIAIALAVAFAAEQLAAAFYPVAPGIDLLSGWASGGLVAPMLRPAKLILAAGWALGSFMGGAFAVRHGHRPLDAYVVAAVVVARALARTYTILHPGWLVAAVLLVPWACAWGAARVARLRH